MCATLLTTIHSQCCFYCIIWKNQSNTVITTFFFPFSSYLEVSQSGLSQWDVLHQQAAVFHRHIWRVEDVNLAGENDSEVSELGYSSQFLAFSYSVHSPCHNSASICSQQTCSYEYIKVFMGDPFFIADMLQKVENSSWKWSLTSKTSKQHESSGERLLTATSRQHRKPPGAISIPRTRGDFHVEMEMLCREV